jgi:hypothetical protein
LRREQGHGTGCLLVLFKMVSLVWTNIAQLFDLADSN